MGEFLLAKIFKNKGVFIWILNIIVLSLYYKHKEMKTTINFLIALVCFGVIIYHYIYSGSIINHPYMSILLITLFAIGGYNLGVTVGNIVLILKK